MDTQEKPVASQPSLASLPRDLIQRRVPHILAIYAGASWGLVEFTAFAVDEFLLSPHWTRMVLITLLMMLPSVVMLAWFHGKPGKDRASLPQMEKIGIPTNLVLCVVALSALFTADELGSTMASVTVETEDGETIEREIPKTRFTKTTALFPLALGPGMTEDESWMSHAVPEALMLDLLADEFFVPILFYGATLRQRGFDNISSAPLTLKRELAQESYAEFMATGEIDRVDDVFNVTFRLYRVDNGSLAGETVHQGTDLLALVDEMSGPVKRGLQIPTREDVEDLPVRGRLSENATAVEAFFKGVVHYRVHEDYERAIEYLTTATTLDPSFAVAHYTLYFALATSAVSQESGEGETVTTAPLVAALENLYRVPERIGFEVKLEYYRRTGDLDRAAAVAEMWVGLYPNDRVGLHHRAALQQLSGDWEGALATLAAIRRLDPLEGTSIWLMALAHENLGNHDQALVLWTEYVERFPGNLSTYLRLADFHRRRNRHEDLREVLERAIAVAPLSQVPALELADLDLDVGRLEEARAGYERALRQARTPAQRAQALSSLSDYHHRRGEMAAAIQAIEGRNEESGFETPLGMAVGDILVYLDGGRTDEAVALLEELRAGLRPSSFTSIASAAVHVALASEGVDAALEAHRQASEAVEAGDIQGLIRPTLLGDLGLIRDHAGDYAGAAESFRAAVALSPAAEYHRGAGRALRRAGLLDEAEAELREALRLVPADPHAHLEMALLMEVRGNPTAAVEHLMSALSVWENADDDFEPAQQARAKLAEVSR